MNAMKCDRCKHYYDDYEGVYRISEYGTLLQKYRVPYNRVIMQNDKLSPKFIDLCPDCMKDFADWLDMTVVIMKGDE